MNHTEVLALALMIWIGRGIDAEEGVLKVDVEERILPVLQDLDKQVN